MTGTRRAAPKTITRQYPSFKEHAALLWHNASQNIQESYRKWGRLRVIERTTAHKVDRNLHNHHISALIFVCALSVIAPCKAQGIGESVETLDTLHQTYEVLEFYKAAAVNPTDLILLEQNIHAAFANDPNRYTGLSNKMAQEMGWFARGPLGLKYVELNPEPSPYSNYGHYSIDLKMTTAKECKVLVRYAKILPNLAKAKVNGNSFYSNGSYIKPRPICKSAWFFQVGKNNVQFIFY